MLYPLSLVYRLVHRLKQGTDQLKAYHAPIPVISIGNLTSGGGGKTPLTIEIARGMAELGNRVGISHRGYRGRYESTGLVFRAVDGIPDSPENIGDEAYMIAQALPQIPVAVGKDRVRAIQSLVSRFPDLQVIILDDSHQNKKVFHDLNILTFNDEIGIGNGFVLPAGYLRESPGTIRDEDLIVLYNKVGDQAKLHELEKVIGSEKDRVFYSEACVSGLRTETGEALSPDDLRGKRLALASGIASPASFERIVKGMDLDWQEHFRYPDHHSFRDVTALEAWLGKDEDAYLLCTEKDIDKLGRSSKLRDRTLAVVLAYRIRDKEKLYRLIERSLELISH